MRRDQPWLVLTLISVSISTSSLGLADEKAPSLPPGFVASSGKLGAPTVRKTTGHGPMQSDHEFTFRTRPSVPGDRADISTLPVVEVTAKDVEPTETPTSVAAGDQGDLVILKVGGNARLSIQAFEAGVLVVGKSGPVATGRQSQGGAPNACGAKSTTKAVVKVRFDALRRVDTSGTLELVWGYAWLDTASCKLSVVSRTAVKPKHIAGGVVYAWRTHCADCKTAPTNELHVITPQTEARKFDFFVPFEHKRLKLAPGVSAGFSGSTSVMSTSFIGWGLPDWYSFVKTKCASDNTFCMSDVHFDVSQGLGESTPTAFVGGDFGAPK